MEDLWAFNEPEVAEAIVQSRIPVISAVGHETDFTIADFAADLRAPTPSAAAELAVPEMNACYDAVSSLSERMRRALTASLERMRSNVKLFASSSAFRLLERRVQSERQTLDLTGERALRAAKERLKSERTALRTQAAKLTALGPGAVLERGYAIVTNEAGSAVSGAERLQKGERVQIRFHDGAADARIEEISLDA